MNEALKEKIEKAISFYPIYQYEFFDPHEIEFSERVREVCGTECPAYGKSWSCPPGCGSIDICKSRCNAFDSGLIFTTVAEVGDASDLCRTLPARAVHTGILRGILKDAFADTPVLALSCENCTICEECTYPLSRCRFSDRLIPCIEGFGIVVTSLAEKLNMDLYLSHETVLWFGIIFF